MPDNPLWMTIFEFIYEFVINSWISLTILAIVWGFAKHLHCEFISRAEKYTSDQPKELYWLNLQCSRWERYVYQIVISVYLFIGLKVFANIFISLGKELLNASVESQTEVAMLNVSEMKIIEFSIFIVIVTFKVRGLMDASGVHRDLKTAGL